MMHSPKRAWLQTKRDVYSNRKVCCCSLWSRTNQQKKDLCVDESPGACALDREKGMEEHLSGLTATCGRHQFNWTFRERNWRIGRNCDRPTPSRTLILTSWNGSFVAAKWCKSRNRKGVGHALKKIKKKRRRK